MNINSISSSYAVSNALKSNKSFGGTNEKFKEDLEKIPKLKLERDESLLWSVKKLVFNRDESCPERLKMLYEYSPEAAEDIVFKSIYDTTPVIRRIMDRYVNSDEKYINASLEYLDIIQKYNPEYFIRKYENLKNNEDSECPTIHSKERNMYMMEKFYPHMTKKIEETICNNICMSNPELYPVFGKLDVLNEKIDKIGKKLNIEL